MLLLLGGPVPDAIGFCLESLRGHLSRGHSGARLLVPTATQAEHLRNKLAREGFVFRPSAVSTFGKFISEIAPGMRPVSAGVLALLVRDVVDGLDLVEFGAVRDTPGFRASVTRALDELSAVGAAPEDVPHPDLRRIYASALEVLRQRGLCFRSTVLRAAAERIREAPVDGPILVTGFQAFTPPETELLRALAAAADLTVTSPAEDAGDLNAFAVETRRLPEADHTAPRDLIVATTLEAECTEVARRLLKLRAHGHSWRDVIVVIRSEQPYAPALRTTLDRYGVPTKFLFASRLSDEPVVATACGLVDAALGNWPTVQSVFALRMSGSPLECGAEADRWEHRMLRAVPGYGLTPLRAGTPRESQRLFDALDTFTASLSTADMPAEWQRRIGQIATLLLPAEVRDGVAHGRALLWKRQAAALAQFLTALGETTAALPAAPLSASDFVASLRLVLQTSNFRVPDNRRDAVHVMDAVEARQWRVPYVFLCGMVERQFPHYHAEDPILTDAIRWRMAGSGFPLATSAERQAAERVLFAGALGAGTEAILLSYPQLNEKGEQNLPSFLLEEAKPFRDMSTATPVRPVAARTCAPEPVPVISDPGLQQRLASQHATLHATGVEAFRHCAYQFFVNRTLHLKEPPADAWDRFTPLVQGNIVHDTLRSHYEIGEPVADAFQAEFARHCQKEQIPAGYRTEAIRLDLLTSVEKFVDRFDAAGEGSSLFEQPFELKLDSDVCVTGRIDRLHVDGQGRALVLDYKYKSKNRMKDMSGEYEQGLVVQGGLYLLATRKLLPQAETVGMLYCGCKRSLEYFGWVLHPYWPQGRNACSPAELNAVMDRSRELALDAAYAIRNGHIAPKPADEARCDWCALRTSCRVEVERRQRTATAEEADSSWR